MRRPLLALAVVTVALHLAGLALAALGMRPGTPAVPLEERMTYLAGSPLGWMIGWAAWMLCSATLIAFLAVAAQQLAAPAPLARLGLTFAVVGCAVDLFCDSAYILVFPMLASSRSNPELFLAVERLTGIASLVIANGGYAVGILLIALEMHGQGRVGRAATAVGLGVAGFALVLAAAAFTNVPWHVEYATGPTMLLFCVWVVLVARSLEKPG